MKKLLFIFTLLFVGSLSAQTQQNDPKQDKSITPLMHATVNNDLLTVTKLVIEGATVNAQSDEGTTALMYASLNDYAEIIEFLLNNEAKINMTDKVSGATALIWASTADSLNAAKKLMQRNANKNIVDKYNKTAIDYARSDEMQKILSPGPKKI